MSTPNVVPAELTVFVNAHREVAGRIDAALDADAPAVAAMPEGYGNMGAMFTVPVEGFEAAFTRTGAAVSGEYRRMSEALEIASTSYMTTDKFAEPRLTTPAGIHFRAEAEWLK